MVAQITQFTLPVPNSYTQDREEFESAVNTNIAELPNFVTQANSLASDVNQLALNAEAAAEGMANAVWVSGTSYTMGQVRYSPIDFYSYRRKTNGAGTTDPSLDPTNWALQTKTSPGGSDTTSSAVDITLSSSSSRLQVVSMTASNKKVTLPSATTLSKGANVFVIKNAGTYRFAVRKNGGVFLCNIEPGQVIAFSCSDISTASGIWAVSGQAVNNIYDGNTAEVLNSVATTFVAVAMLSATKAICAYKNGTSTFVEAVILNYGSASGTPLAISAEASKNISIAALSSSKAVMVYQPTASSNVKGYVLDVSGNTITPGTVQTIHTAAGTSGAEGTALAMLSSTQLLCIFGVSGDTNIKERVLDVSGTTITASSAVNADATAISTSQALHSQVEMISTTKAIVAMIGTSNQLLVRLQSITGSTPAATGSVLSITASGSPPVVAHAACVMNANRAVLIRSIDRLYGDFVAYLIDISGTTPTLITSKQISIDGLSGTGAHISASKLDANRVYVTWPGNFSLGSDGIVLNITADDRIVVGEIAEKLEPSVTSAFGYVACDALDSSHVMQVCRNGSTFLSAKTIEIG